MTHSRSDSILLNEDLYPFSFSIGFLEISLPELNSGFLRWKENIRQSVQSEPADRPFVANFSRLEPLTTQPKTYLFYSCASGWIAYVNNGARGPDVMPLVCHLSQQFRCRAVIATCIPHTLKNDADTRKGVFGAVQFELYSSHPTDFLNMERSVGVAYESRWRFDQAGKVQPFEEVDNYSKRIVTEKFTVDMLRRYCEALGIKVDERDFYVGPGTIHRLTNPLPATCRTFSLVEARRELGFPPRSGP